MRVAATRAAAGLALLVLVTCTVQVAASVFVPMFDDETHHYGALRHDAQIAWRRGPAQGAMGSGWPNWRAVEESGGTVFALGPDSALHAIEPATGRDRWRFGGVPDREVWSYRVDGDVLVAVTGTTWRYWDQKTLVRIDPATGAPLWERALVATVSLDSLRLTPGVVAIAVEDLVPGPSSGPPSPPPSTYFPRLLGFDARDGSFRWERALRETAADSRPPPTFIRTTAVAGVVVAMEPGFTGSRLLVVDAATGEVLWRSDDVAGVMPLGRDLLVTERLNPFGDGQSRFQVSVLAGRTGDVLRESKPGAGIFDEAVTDGRYVYSGPSAFDTDSMRQLWALHLDAAVQTLPQFLTAEEVQTGQRLPRWHDGHLYVVGRDGDLYSILVPAGRVEWKFRPVHERDIKDRLPPPVAVGGLVIVPDDELIAYRMPH